MQSSFSEGSKVLRIAHEHAKRCKSFRKALQNIEAEAPTSLRPEPDDNNPGVSVINGNNDKDR